MTIHDPFPAPDDALDLQTLTHKRDELAEAGGDDWERVLYVIGFLEDLGEFRELAAVLDVADLTKANRLSVYPPALVSRVPTGSETSRRIKRGLFENTGRSCLPYLPE
jgi:hypothetical protein